MLQKIALAVLVLTRSYSFEGQRKQAGRVAVIDD